MMSNPTVLITGANHGIGAATAKALARQGAKIFLTAYRPPTPFSDQELHTARETGLGGPTLYAAMQQQPLDLLLTSLEEEGAVVAGIEANLGEPASIPFLFDTCNDMLGPVDVLVINHTHCVLETFDPARVRPDGFPVSMVSTREIDAHFIVNARATALLIAEFARRHIAREARWGRIITISTDAAGAHKANVSYAASKHAIESYSRSAAQELGSYGITVNIVAPGPIQTGYLTPQQEAQISASTPLGRVGLPEDVADVITFLASDAARWLTGQLIYVGGGWKMGD